MRIEICIAKEKMTKMPNGAVLVHRIQRRSLLMHGLPSTVKYNECADTGVRDHVSAHSPSLRRRP